MYSIMNDFKGLKAAARFNRPYKTLPSPFKECLKSNDREKERLALTRKTMLSACPFYSRGLETQSAFLAVTLLFAEHIMQLSSWHRSSLQWKPPPEWGFWAQTFPCVLFAAFYNKPSPTQIHIFIILFLEMQFEEGKCDLTF